VNADHVLGLSGSCASRYPEHEPMVTSARYSDMLEQEPRPAICTKWQGRSLEYVVILHNSTLLHTTAHIRESLQGMKFEILEHLAYNPDLAPFVCYLFRPIKGAVRMNIFTYFDDCFLRSWCSFYFIVVQQCIKLFHSSDYSQSD
jgi:hypothetical protein